jgi:hypothetical protein
MGTDQSGHGFYSKQSPEVANKRRSPTSLAWPGPANLRQVQAPPGNVVLNRWRLICPHCFDLEVEIGGVRYTFEGLEGQIWSELPTPRDLNGRPGGGSARL